MYTKYIGFVILFKIANLDNIFRYEGQIRSLIYHNTIISNIFLGSVSGFDFSISKHSCFFFSFF